MNKRFVPWRLAVSLAAVTFAISCGGGVQIPNAALIRAVSSNGGGSGQGHVIVTKTAQGQWTQVFRWTIQKTADPASLNLRAGGSGNIVFTIQVTKVLDHNAYSAVGQITARNNDEHNTAQVDWVKDVVQALYPDPTTGACDPATDQGQWKDLSTSNPTPQTVAIAPKSSYVWSYENPFTPDPLACAYRNIALVHLANGADNADKSPPVAFSLPSSPTGKVLDTITVKDNATIAPSGLTYSWDYNGPWSFSDSGQQLVHMTINGNTAGSFTLTNEATVQETGQSSAVQIPITVVPISITWAKTYGGPGDEYASYVQQTSDGGYIVAGNTAGSFNCCSIDAWVLKLDPAGNVLWQKTYGGPGAYGPANDSAQSVQQTPDGGYIVAGYTHSFGAGDSDAWVLRLDPAGNVLWQKTYGGPSFDGAAAIRQTPDGGYIFAGLAYSFCACVWAVKLDSAGNVQWQNTYGGTSGDQAYDIQPTSDGGYVMGGHHGGAGAWVLKLDSSGNVLWQNSYGGLDAFGAQAIQQTSDGGYIVAGDTQSFGAGSDDALVLKLDASGTIVWQKTYGGAGFDYATSIRQTSDGGYVVAGDTQSFGAGSDDAWVLKLDANGNVGGCVPPGIGIPFSGGSAATAAAGAASPGISFDTFISGVVSSAIPADSTAVPAVQCTG